MNKFEKKASVYEWEGRGDGECFTSTLFPPHVWRTMDNNHVARRSEEAIKQLFYFYFTIVQ
jgi:hypothetical protein